jgi:Potato inhibitor I family
MRERLTISEKPQDRLHQMQQRHKEGVALAKTLTGLSRSEAVERVTAAGLHPQVVTPEVEAITADLRFDRVFIFVDSEGLVTRASAT